MRGAPIRFVAAVVGGWICIRIAVLLPETAPLQLAGDVLAPPAAASERPPSTDAILPVPTPMMIRERSAEDASGLKLAVRVAAVQGVADDAVASAGTAEPGQTPNAADAAVPAILVPVTLGSPSNADAVSRWAGSAWLLARGGASGTLTGGRLGASQAGVRITYLLDRTHRVALAARIATPLRGRGTEGAVGVDWQPTAAPVHLVVEQRIAIDGARGGPTAMAIAGLDPTPIAAGFRLETYAQGGAILRGGKAEAFGDGAARLTRPVVALGRARIDLGLGAWAAGQRGAARADFGPTVGMALPVAGRSVRLSLDWRQRVAGDARPGSGPALSVGSDF